MALQKLENNTEDIARLLKSLSNDKRLEIACLLARGESSVGELEKVVDLSQSALSQHLARLRKDNIVKTRREAQTIYYSLLNGRVKALLECLDSLS